MPLALIGLIVMAVASLAGAAYVFLGERSRREIVVRTAAPSPTAASYRERGGVKLTDGGAAVARLTRLIPKRWTASASTEQKLVHAGHDGPMAPVVFAAVRVALAMGLPLLALIFVPKARLLTFLLDLGVAAAVGLLLPTYYLARSARVRQERITRSLPDCLDLLVVCIEAGISLDAALLRVAKDLGAVHPDLSRELLIVNQKTNAGMPRADALRCLWDRTGVVQIRALVSHIVQGEKWGTSSGRVLRVYAETLRRERKQTAEKKAATAPVKMLIPLGLFIFPAILLVVMGPVVIAVSKMFSQQ